jgi:hypothetical protein
MARNRRQSPAPVRITADSAPTVLEDLLEAQLGGGPDERRSGGEVPVDGADADPGGRLSLALPVPGSTRPR